MTVTCLFVKRAHGARLEPVAELDVSPQGIAGSARCSPLRQVLITSRSVTEECGLQAGDLRENIVVDCPGFYDLPSGTVVRIGAALVRLTFHCEPCKKIMHLIDSGVTVIGAASMGALRAAELDAYGMLGVGRIYQMYASGEICGDDEVATLLS